MKEHAFSAGDLFEVRARLGEGPVWDDAGQHLYWIDIYNHRVHRFEPLTGQDRIIRLPEIVTCLALTLSPRLLIALRHDLALLDPESGMISRLLTLEGDMPRNRFNDGKVDPQGRLWIGTMSKDARAGSLYRFDADGTVRTMEKDVTISNGLGWSPDQRTFYYTDSPLKVIYAYDYEAEGGSIRNRRVFADLTTGSAFPDGLAVDAEGCVWSAQWDGWCVIRFAPDGRELERIRLPVQRPTSCAFGDTALRRLYVTSASVALTEQEIQACPLSGDLFWIDVDVPGLPPNRFAGG